MPPVLTHLALHVRDLDACMAFYRAFCGMQIVHERLDAGRRVVWLAEPGREKDFIIVMVPGGEGRHQAATDYSHLGFALDSHAAVDAVAEQARRLGCLVWAPRQEPYPVGYYCGIRDPNGTMVEFSYGQPLGPGAPAPVSSRKDTPVRYIHDRGGWPDAGPIDTAEHAYSMWEKQTDALMRLLSRDKRLIRVDELRRTIESLAPAQYEAMQYYERWITAIEMLLVEKGVLTQAEIERQVATFETSAHG